MLLLSCNIYGESIMQFIQHCNASSISLHEGDKRFDVFFVINYTDMMESTINI